MAVITAQEISDSPAYLPFTSESVAVYAGPSRYGVALGLALRLPLSNYQMSIPIDSPKHREDRRYWYSIYPLGEHVMLKAFKDVVKAKRAKKRLASLIELAQAIDVLMGEGWVVCLADNIHEASGLAVFIPSVLFAPPGGRGTHVVDATLWNPSFEYSRLIRNLTKSLTSVETGRAAVRVDPLLTQEATVDHKLVQNGRHTERLIEELRQEQERELLSAAIAKHPEMEVGRLLGLVEAARRFLNRGTHRALSEGKKQLSAQDAG